MTQFLFIVWMFLSQIGYSQSSDKGNTTVIKTGSGELIVNKSDNSLSVWGKLDISSQTASEAQKSGIYSEKQQLELVLNKECKVTEISADKSMHNKIIHEELKKFAADLLLQISRQKLDYLFQFDNELGFVNEDSCSDNLNVTIALIVK